MKQIIFGMFIALLLLGCSQNRVKVSDIDIDKTLIAQDKSYIYDIKMQDIASDLKVHKSPLEQFPFIHNKQAHLKGHFSPEFYAEHNYGLKAQQMDKVNFWELQKNPQALDIIYTKDILLENYKNISQDIFTNLCYAHGLSKLEQDILRQWIQNGGVLWVESSLYSIDPIRSLDHGLKTDKFLGKEVRFVNIPQTQKSRVYNTTNNKPYFDSIHSLELYKKRYSQICMIVDGDSLVATPDETVVSMSRYGEGMIISLLPFEYEKLYRDGELLRWKLLSVIHDPSVVQESAQRALQTDIQAPILPPATTEVQEPQQTTEIVVQEEQMQPQAEPIQESSTPAEVALTKGNCIQLYTAFSYKKAKKYFSYAQDFPLARIEKRGKAYTARVGMYAKVQDAKETLQQLKKHYPSAFIRRCVLK